LVLGSDYDPDDGSRIVGKVYAAVSGSGNAPTVKIYYQGTSGSRWEIPANTEVLSDIFIKQEDIGTADGEILKSDGGLTDDQIVRATADGLESRTNAQILTQLGIDGALDITNKVVKADCMFHAYLSADQLNISNATDTLVTLDSELFDVGADFDTGNHKFVAPVTGYYDIRAGIQYDSVVADKRYLVRVYKDFGGGGETLIIQGHSNLVYLTAGDELFLVAIHNAGVDTVDINSDSYDTFLSGRLVAT